MTTFLQEQIEGSRRFRFWREFLVGSAVFPIFDAIRVLADEGVISYLLEVPHYLLIGAAGLQAWFLSSSRDHPWWMRFLGNLIGPTLYTLGDLLIEGPASFIGQPYHWVYWIFCLGMALFSTLEYSLRRMQAWVIVLANLWRVLLFPSIYVLSEVSQEFVGAFTWANFKTYWVSSTGHIFILLISIIFGLMLGINEAQIHRYMTFLRHISRRLKKYSEWLLSPELVEESLKDETALSQRRVERVVLFMDIRGFTEWSEDKDPESVVGMLNRFYEISETIIMQGGGEKPHFIGDEIMTWFSNAAVAIETTRRLMREITVLLSQYDLASGAGLHIGEVVEGLMGSTSTRTYNVLGDTVNTTSRLCSSAEPGEVLLSDALVKQLGMSNQVETARQIQVKGKQHALTVYPLS